MGGFEAICPKRKKKKKKTFSRHLVFWSLKGLRDWIDKWLKKKNKKKKRTPTPPGNVRPNSFVPRAPKGKHAGESSLASTKCHCLS